MWVSLHFTIFDYTAMARNVFDRFKQGNCFLLTSVPNLHQEGHDFLKCVEYDIILFNNSRKE